ncbi:Hypothetical protein PHPALM_2651 [Phytophthora palmivora]|uniref:Uncharacterized protein n=1 Tax=Phytophthora palmivora TaxID=4796 RepID=A0A2P4YPA2_9STRA|nr:Hypothetical protein PHPALM_2651 [Phytophthora palmivora]
MHKRPISANSNAAVASIDQQDAFQFKKFIGKKKRSHSSVSIPVLSVLVVLAGILLLRSSLFNKPGIDLSPLSEEEKVAVFMEWFRAGGGNVSDKIAIETFPGMGRVCGGER